MQNYHRDTDQQYFQITKASRKTDLSDQSKTCNDPKKIREDKSRTESLNDMADGVFAESLKSPECKKSVKENKGYLHINILNTRPSNYRQNIGN